MPEISQHPSGTFCWVDGGTGDLEGAQAFYASVFGWDYTTDEQYGYTTCLKKGRSVAGLYTLNEEMRAAGAAPHWLPYVAVADADATMARAVKAGATPALPVFDVPGQGKGGAFLDPSGAVCGIWQPAGHEGFGLEREHGAPSWMELQVPDPQEVGKFYRSVFDWDLETLAMPEGPYYRFKLGDEALGGMMAITPAMGDVPPHWAVYFHVDDAAAAVAAASRAGGSVVVPVMDLGSWGRMAVLRSPDGAYLSLLEAAPMP